MDGGDKIDVRRSGKDVEILGIDVLSEMITTVTFTFPLSNHVYLPHPQCRQRSTER